jgi:biofilm protein TabA
MILAHLEQADRYLILHGGFPAAIGFLREQPLAELPEGRIEIAAAMYATVFRGPLRQRSEARLEAHRHYIDIQYVIAGVEEMGWSPRANCRRPQGLYDKARDIEFFDDAPDSYVTVRVGEFAIFFPEDTHAPLVGEGEVRKVVVKVPA